MLRQKAATHLIIVVDNTGTQSVEYLEGSNVRVVRDDDLGDHILIDVDVDKNVNALKRRKAYIPDEVRALGMFPVHMLENLLIKYRPPSGGVSSSRPPAAQN